MTYQDKLSATVAAYRHLAENATARVSFQEKELETAKRALEYTIQNESR